VTNTFFVPVIIQGYAVITVLRNNFDNGWIGFDERTSSRLKASEESREPLVLTLRRQSSVSFGQLVVSFAAPCSLSLTHSFAAPFVYHVIS